MEKTEDYITKIKSHIAAAELSDALRLLEEMSIRFHLKSIHTEALSLQGRLSAISQSERLAFLSFGEVEKVKNHIGYSILLILKNYEDGLIHHKPISSLRERGRIVHNIPPKMQIEEEMYCSVRIAKDDLILLEGFELPDANKPADLDISRTMEVSLVDPSGGNIFRVRRISEFAEQEVVLDRFTEWDFGITPLKNGKQLLYLYAYFIDKVEDKETRRAISFKRPIEITTEPVEETLTTWQPTDIVLGGEEDKAKSGLPTAGTGAALKSIKTLVLLLAAGAVFAGLAYWVNSIIGDKTPKNPEVPSSTLPSSQSNLVQPILIWDKSFLIESIEISGKAAQNWTYNQDSTEIQLPEQAIGTAFFNVKGKKGSCTQKFKLTKDNNRVIMSCKLSETINIPTNTPKPQSRKFSLNILTTFRLPIIKIDGNIVAVDKTVSIGNIIRSVVTVQEGSHQISATDQNGMNICNQKTMDVNDNNLTVDMACKRETITVTFISRNDSEASFYDGTKITLGKSVLNQNRYKITPKFNKDNNFHMKVEIYDLIIGETYEISFGHDIYTCKKTFKVDKIKNEIYIDCVYENIIN
jgi:DNA transporter